MDFWAGYAGGVAGVLVSHPMDLIRTRQTLNRLSMGATVRLLAAEPGWICGLYRGVYSPCVFVGLWKSLVLGIYKSWLGSNTTPSLFDTIIAACVSGTLGAAALGPAEVIKLRTMTQTREGSRTSLLQMEREALSKISTRDILRSTGLLCLRDGYGTIGFMVPYEYSKRMIDDAHIFSSRSLLPAMLAGMFAGPIAWTLTYPIEVYRIHAFDEQFCRKFRKGAGWRASLSLARAIHRNGGGGLPGCRAWFHGLPACALRSCLQMPATMVVFEYVRTWGTSASS